MDECCRRAADARAEEIAAKIEAHSRGHYHPHPSALFIQQGLAEAKEIARSTIEKPKTREQVLEEALREASSSRTFTEIDRIVKRALDWKP